MAEDKPLSIEEVLAAEVDAIGGIDSETHKPLAPTARNQDVQHKRIWMNADERDSADSSKADVDAQREFYRSLNRLNRGALCLSGGGIRSATFCLGVIQALAGYDVCPLETAPDEPPPADDGEITPDNSLLGRLHYLSTVSGGGYVGSWLSAWRVRTEAGVRTGFDTILRNLTGRPSGADVEPPEISWLRAYSNYLTPQLGVASADAWAAIAIVVRNLILNWLIIIPVVCLALLALKLIATASVGFAHSDLESLQSYHRVPLLLILFAGILFLIFAQAFTTRHRPSRRPSYQYHQPDVPAQNDPVVSENIYEHAFLLHDLIWSFLSAIAVTIFFSSRYFASRVGAECGVPGVFHWFGFAVDAKFGIPLVTALSALPVFAVGWIAGWPSNFKCRDWLSWTACGLVYGALIGLGAYLYLRVLPYSTTCSPNGQSWHLMMPVIFGVPWVLLSQLIADSVFVGLVSYEPMSDSDREWLGRAAGWLAAAAIAWAVTAFLVFEGGHALQFSDEWIKKLIAAAGGISGIVVALLGKSSLTPATSESGQGDYAAKISNIVLAVAGPVFAAILIMVLSVLLDRFLLGGSLVDQLQNALLSKKWIVVFLFVGFVIMTIVAAIASVTVNINRFSLHALYRNRLIRAYLGASRRKRQPDRFTGFDTQDNVRMWQLWPHDLAPRRLFHVVNIALNVVSTKRLAWQERKAESFTVSPLHCGSAYLGFRSSATYGDGPDKDAEPKQSAPEKKAPERPQAADNEHHVYGIALGTAMAISGAAVSPNMGYHSSPSITLLLTLFNVRLGWWLGNPGPAGNQDNAYQHEGPKWASKPLFYEAFGQTTDSRPYVYLSDGGHFENLGLYEMVRRRCRFIILVDAGCDPKFAFEDLGNAVRKIFIDLGIRIEFKGLNRLINRPEKDDPAPEKIPYFSVGNILYSDPEADGRGCENGTVIYIKPAYHGTEGAALQSYAKANKTFPHETTTDQWFTESQFESYRALGLDIAKSVFADKEVRDSLHKFVKPAVHHVDGAARRP